MNKEKAIELAEYEIFDKRHWEKTDEDRLISAREIKPRVWEIVYRLASIVISPDSFNSASDDLRLIVDLNKNKVLKIEPFGEEIETACKLACKELKKLTDEADNLIVLEKVNVGFHKWHIGFGFKDSGDAGVILIVDAKNKVIVSTIFKNSQFEQVGKNLKFVRKTR